MVVGNRVVGNSDYLSSGFSFLQTCSLYLLHLNKSFFLFFSKGVLKEEEQILHDYVRIGIYYKFFQPDKYCQGPNVSCSISGEVHILKKGNSAMVELQKIEYWLSMI